MKPEISDIGNIMNATERQITKEICLTNFGKKYSISVSLKDRGFSGPICVKTPDYDSELDFLKSSDVEKFLVSYSEEKNDKKPLKDYLKYIKTLKQESLF